MIASTFFSAAPKVLQFLKSTPAAITMLTSSGGVITAASVNNISNQASVDLNRLLLIMFIAAFEGFATMMHIHEPSEHAKISMVLVMSIGLTFGINQSTNYESRLHQRECAAMQSKIQDLETQPSHQKKSPEGAGVAVHASVG